MIDAAAVGVGAGPLTGINPGMEAMPSSCLAILSTHAYFSGLGVFTISLKMLARIGGGGRPATVGAAVATAQHKLKVYAS